MASNGIVAAGAVVTRGEGRKREYLIVHRGYRDDWTFPKGKVDPGEHIIAAAVREIREETGYAVRLGLPLPSRHYSVNGIPKTAHYWHAEPLDGEFHANDEVDEVRWVRADVAAKLLTYPDDAKTLSAAADTQMSSPFVLLRHTQAIKRTDWAVDVDPLSAEDSSRPLTPIGRMQATALIPVLAAYGVDSLHTSDSRRCRDTLGPFASARSLALNLIPAISEERHHESPAEAHDAMKALALNPSVTALCTHRPVLPTVMAALAEEFVHVGNSGKKDFDPALTPGSLVVFHRSIQDARTLMAIERHIRQ